jgi:hypothetical protein
MTGDQVAALGPFYHVAPDPDFPTLHRCTCLACGRTFAVAQGDTSRYTVKRLLAHTASHTLTIHDAAPP